jgi:hypothetical protein
MPILIGEMIRNNQKQFFLHCFCHFVAIWAPPNQPKSPQVGYRCMAQYLNLKVSPNLIITPILLEEMVQNNLKTSFLCFFCHFEAI